MRYTIRYVIRQRERERESRENPGREDRMVKGTGWMNE